MAIPTEKHPQIEALLGNRRAAIAGDKCTWCGGPAIEFKDALSRKEYSISGLCQKCQDQTFGDNDNV